MKNFISPSHIQIETVGGACTARCTMCTINTGKRPKGVMSFEKFKLLIEKLKCIKKSAISYLARLGKTLAGQRTS